MKNSLVRTNIFLSVAERNGFTKLAKERGTSAAALMRACLDEALGLEAETIMPISFKHRTRMIPAKSLVVKRPRVGFANLSAK